MLYENSVQALQVARGQHPSPDGGGKERKQRVLAGPGSPQGPGGPSVLG